MLDSRIVAYLTIMPQLQRLFTLKCYECTITFGEIYGTGASIRDRFQEGNWRRPNKPHFRLKELKNSVILTMGHVF
jgi:hypothetical protein